MQLTAPMPRSVRSQVITRRTYCRPLDENETQFETWPMVAGRVVEHQRRLWEDALGCSLRDHQNQELDLLGELLLDRKVCVAGRTLWLGGTDIAYRRPASQFNCSFAVLRTVHDAVDLFWLLLQGCGVGFKPSPGALFGFCRPMEVRFTKSKRGKNERGREHNIEWYDSAKSEWTISVGDSAEAWAKSLGKILAGKFPATKLHIDFSEIRGAGTRLKGYGWLSSGDSSLSVAYQAIVGIMNKAAGRLLSKIEMLDIINWCGTVLSSRRSAEIALVDYKSPEWLEFASAKTTEKLMTEYQRYQSNNSVVYYAHPGRAAIQNQFQLMMDNGGSEPGMVNGEEAVNRAPWFAGVNPCVTGDTRILTSAGYRRIDSLVGVETEVWNGLQWSKVKPFSTGVNPLVEVQLSDGTSLKCTPYHEFLVGNDRVRANDLRAGDAIATFDMPIVGEDEDDGCDLDAYESGSCFYERLVSGGDVDDSWIANAVPLDEDFSYRADWYGAYISAIRFHGPIPSSVAKLINPHIRLLQTTLGITPDEVSVVAVIDLQREEETYCFTDDHNHTGTFEGIVTGQCGEILLADRGFCNLVTINLPAFRGNNHALHEAARIIARANYRQTCVDLRDGILQTAWHENNQFLRLCGVSVSGIAQRPDLTAHDYRRLRNSATFGAYSMADELGLQRPGNVTTIKPEGTISKAIFDSTEGCHYPLGKHIFNNVCFGQHDPLLPKLREAGYEVRQHPSDPTSMIVTLPVEWSDVKLTHVNGCYVNCQSAVEQLERYRMLMQNYCDQNVSVTISYDDDEKDEIVDWLNKNWSDYVGVSFIRRADPFKTAEDLGYPYLPQEVVTEERYREYAAKLKPLIVDSIEDHSGEIDVGQDCAGGMCPVR